MELRDVRSRMCRDRGARTGSRESKARSPPRDSVGNDDAIPERATRQRVAVSHQRSAMLTFGHHGRLPGNVPRGGRLTYRGRLCCRSKSCNHVPAFASCRNDAQDVRDLFEQRRGGDLLPLHNDCRLDSIRETNNGICSEIFDNAWQRRVTRSSLTRHIATKRLRTNRNIALQNPINDSVPPRCGDVSAVVPNFVQDFGKS